MLYFLLSRTVAVFHNMLCGLPFFFKAASKVDNHCVLLVRDNHTFLSAAFADDVLRKLSGWVSARSLNVAKSSGLRFSPPLIKFLNLVS